MSGLDSSVKDTILFPWFALQVRSRREGFVATYLEGQGFECFLPLYKSKRRWSDRVKEVEQPLFPGYLFCRLDLSNRGPLLMAPGVQQIVGVGRTPMPVEEREIESIRQVQSSGLPSLPWPYMHVGEKVRVNYGSFVNLEGILVNFKGSNRVVLSVTMLQRSVAMEIDLAWVSPVREAKPAQGLRVLGDRPRTVIVTG
ncbi:MAG: UpxY family transcription antiterminator [Candidatus Acidiferrum sp.]